MLKQILSNPTFVSIINGQLRHAGTFLGGILVARGLIETGQVETVAGFVVAIGGMVLSALAKRV